MTLANSKVVAAPASYITQQAIALGDLGEPAIAISASNPLPTLDRALRGAVAVMPGGADVTPAQAFAVTASVGGTVAIRLADGSTLTVPVEPGFSLFPFSVRGVATAGTTAIATYASLL